MMFSEFLLDSKDQFDGVLGKVEQHWPVLRERDSTRSLSYLDTFDWRLFVAGRMLYTTSERGVGELTLATLDGKVCHRTTASGTPAFSRDLPPGPRRKVVAAAVDPRRLSQLVCLRVHEETVRVLNAGQKTVLRLDIQQRTARRPGRSNSSKAVPSVLRVTPIKGYGREHDACLALLVDELGLSSNPGGAYASAMAAVDLTPGGYTSKLAVGLWAQMRAEAAARVIHRTQLDAMLLNTDGVRRNLDPEFLHDYRVAIRRTRSALKQIPAVFPDSAVAHFANEFKWLGKITGVVRDLDVYLLKMDDFRAELPQDMRAHLQPLDKYLAVHDVKEHRNLVSTLTSRRYRTLMTAWPAFLEQPLPEDGTRRNAARPVVELATERIWHAYRRVYKHGRVIGPQTPAADLHALRVECKKLRYLLEFFTALYPPREMRELIGSLKQLQNNLGSFNDCEVQQSTLRRFANEMHEEGLSSVDSLLAVGRLIEHLLRQQLDERQRFESCFALFSQPDNRKCYRRLFKRAGKSSQ